jgi:hypothetical protein
MIYYHRKEKNMMWIISQKDEAIQEALVKASTAEAKLESYEKNPFHLQAFDLSR